MDAMQVQQLLTQAIGHLQSQNLASAEGVLRQVLTSHPNQPDALHYLGVVALQAGQPKAGAELIHRSLSIAQNFAAFNNLGQCLLALGRADDALGCFDRAIGLQPGHPDAYWNAATLLASSGRHEPAARVLSRLVELQPRHPRANLLLGTCLGELEYFERAASAFRAHLAIDPGSAEAMGRLSTQLSKLNRHDSAVECAVRAVELAPDLAEAHNNLGWVMQRAGRLEEAEAAFRRAIDLKPDFTMALGNYAALCEKDDRLEQAVTLFERAAAADPRHLEAHCSLAGAYSRVGRYTEALAAAERALAIDRHSAAAHGHRSLALLAFGRYEEGFAEYEWRWKCKDFTTPERDFDQPRWTGSDPRGRTILIHCEQGYGDNIQFARYLPLLAERGAKVIAEAPVALRGLFETVPGVSKVISAGLRPPPFDLQAPLLSLPHVLKTSLATVPAPPEPYFRMPPGLVEARRAELASRLGRFNIGLLWRGKRKPNPKRSIPLIDLAPLAIEGVTFVSLQAGEQAGVAERVPAGMNLVEPGAVTDFLDLAAVISLMDLVITIDSGPAHLAGALHKPTWTMLIRNADWRWLQDRDDSPWYPTMRLFRQAKTDDWSDVIARVGGELRTFAERVVP